LLKMDMSRYLDLFLAESREHLAAAHAICVELARHAAEADPWPRFMRHAHSIKGMAASMRFTSIVTLTHAVEDLAELLARAGVDDAQRCLPLLDESLLCLGSMLDALERGDEATNPRVESLATALRKGCESVVTHEPTLPPPSHRPRQVSVEPRAGLRRWMLLLHLDRDGGRSASETVAILSEVGRLARVVVPGTPALDPRTGGVLGGLRLIVASERPGEVLREELSSLLGPQGFMLEPEPTTPGRKSPEEDPPPWIRIRADKLDALVEGLLELKHEHGRLKAALPRTRGAVHDHLALAELRRRELYGAAMEMRLVPFDSVAQRLREAVRELADELGKRVSFEINGGELQMDRAILDALLDPLLHALKNSLDHGIETPAERRRSGKPACASLRLGLRREGERVRICVVDDGRGMRPELLRQAAVKRGVVPAGQAEALSDEQALMLTTLPGLTTRPSADHISGRGIGLDVVRQVVESLGGFVEIRSERDRGCTLFLSVPLSRALIRTLLVRCTGQDFALPIEAVVKTIDVEQPPSGLRLVHLDRRLGLDGPRSVAVPRSALVLAGSKPSAALVVDEVAGRQDLLVQPLHAPLANLRAYSGAALGEDGSIVLVLDPVGVASEVRFRRGAVPASGESVAWEPHR